MKALVDDPAWVLERYREAKEIIEDCWDLQMDQELRQRLDDFHTATVMDTCTTFGSDCGCNPR